MKRSLMGTTALAALMAVGGVETAAAQAVAYPNATLGGFGGGWGNQLFSLSQGTVTLPLGPFGVQATGMAGSLGSATYYQGAGQFFWRNPGIGLLGVNGSLTGIKLGGATQETWRIGPEAELYLGNFTLSAVGGWKYVNNVGAGNFVQAKAQFYLTPINKIWGGYIFDGISYGNVGFEHQVGNKGFSIFAEGRFSANTAGGWFGFRGYFGGGGTAKPLINRDRQDVAPIWIHLTEVVGSSSSTTPGPTATPPPSIPPGGM